MELYSGGKDRNVFIWEPGGIWGEEWEEVLRYREVKQERHIYTQDAFSSDED